MVASGIPHPPSHSSSTPLTQHRTQPLTPLTFPFHSPSETNLLTLFFSIFHFIYWIAHHQLSLLFAVALNSLFFSGIFALILYLSFCHLVHILIGGLFLLVIVPVYNLLGLKVSSAYFFSFKACDFIYFNLEIATPHVFPPLPRHQSFLTRDIQYWSFSLPLFSFLPFHLTGRNLFLS